MNSFLDKNTFEQNDEYEEKAKTAKLKSEEINKNIQEAISGLMVLGYTKKDIEKAFEHLDVENLSIEDLIK